MNSDFINGCLCILTGMIWVAVARQWVPDSPLGVAIILVPAGLVILPGIFLIARFRFKNLR
jgi:hypothetical protein